MRNFLSENKYKIFVLFCIFAFGTYYIVEKSFYGISNRDEIIYNEPLKLSYTPDIFSDQVEVDITSNYAYAKFIGHNQPLFDKNASIRVAPASLTKMMTVLTAIDNIENLDAIAPIDRDAYLTMVNGNSSMAGFYGNEQTTYRDLLYGTILSSGGEAAMSLAINISGSEKEFVKLMNKKANDLNLLDTNFKNSTGFDEDGHYSTANDLALIVEEGLKNPVFKAVFSTKDYVSSPTNSHPKGLEIQSTVLRYNLKNTHADYQILGGKSGTTKNAGQAWATYAIIDNELAVVVTTGAPLDSKFIQVSDTHKIYSAIIKYYLK